MDKDKIIRQYVPVWKTWNKYINQDHFGFAMGGFVRTFNKNKKDSHKWKLYEWLFE